MLRPDPPNASPAHDLESSVIFQELATYWRTEPGCRDLLQFRRRATAHQYRKLYRLIETYLTPGAAVLDWGCGNGHASYGLVRRGFQVSGYSFDDFGLRAHLGEGYVFRQGTGDDPVGLPFAPDSFDGVLSVGVLEHVRETGGREEASLREIQRVLRPGGVFICYHLPNRYSWIEAVTRRLPSVHSHRYRYTRLEIERLCRRSGLEVATTGRYGALPRNLWHRMPARPGDSAWVAEAWDRLDAALGVALAPICQNFYFVARKGRGGTLPMRGLPG